MAYVQKKILPLPKNMWQKHFFIFLFQKEPIFCQDTLYDKIPSLNRNEFQNITMCSKIIY